MSKRSLLTALALAAALAGCNRRPDDVAVVVSAIGNTARIGDPSLESLDTAQRLMLDATAQGLVRFGADGQVEPGLAERWIVTDNGRSYIFRLAPARWPDGRPLTARAVVRALNRAIAPASRNPLKPFLLIIDEIVEMTPQVVEVRLKRPRPDLLRLFAQPELAIFDRATGNGSGPFRVQPTSGPGGVLLRPLPPVDLAQDEVDAPDPEDHVRLRGERAAAAIWRFQERESDLVTGGTFVDWPIVTVAKIAPANVRLDPALGLFGLAVVERGGFLSSPVNRAAVAMAIDRSALLAGFPPEWAPLETLLPDRLDSAQPPAAPAWRALPLDQRRAQARATVADWIRANGAPRLRIALPTGPGATLLWRRLAASLDAIGIIAERVSWHADSDLRLVDRVAPYDSGRFFLATACQPCGKAAQILVDAAREAPTLNERALRIADADRALADDTAFIPLATPLRWSLVAMRLTAWTGNPRAWHPLNRLRNERR